ncbi:MAG TPA: glycosyltransferase family 4 protein [Drouetiella sp.]|jgi:glycogen synthase
MRICLISREYPPETSWGGIGAYTYQHANALAALGHDVEVIALARKEDTVEPPVANGAENSKRHVIQLHRAVWGHLLDELATIWISLPYSHYLFKTTIALWNKFTELHAKKPFDVVEAPEHLAEGLLVAMTKSCPLVVRLHTPHFKFVAERYHDLKPSFDHTLFGMLERMTILNADAVSSPSQELANYVARDCGYDAKSIHIVRNGVDIEKFSPAGPKTLEPSEQVTVMFAGRLEERKGIHQLIDAIPLVLEQTKNVRFVIVGRDMKVGRQSVAETVKRRLLATNSSQYVQFINHVPLSEMPGLYRSADICVVPSLYENAPYTVLEAMACGRPVVATSAGGTPEYIDDGATGFVIPPGRPADIAAAIVKLVISPERRTAFGEAARDKAHAMLESKRVVQDELSVYEKAIINHRTSAQYAQYRKPPEEAFADIRDLIYAYHLNLYQLIYVHSLTFRIKHWLLLGLKRPRLCAAKALLSPLNIAHNLSGNRSARLAEFTEKLDTDIRTKELEREEMFKSLIGNNIRKPFSTNRS